MEAISISACSDFPKPDPPCRLGDLSTSEVKIQGQCTAYVRDHCSLKALGILDNWQLSISTAMSLEKIRT